VGTVFIALADASGTIVKELNLMGDRDRIRWWASQHALDFIRRSLL
jgi:nicotinamide-nucleotide amidase